MKLFVAIQLVLFSVGISIPSLALTAGALTQTKKWSKQVSGELVVKLKNEPNKKNSGAFEQIAQNLRNKLTSKGVVKVRHLLTTEQFAVLKLNDSDLEAAIELLKKDPSVAYAEPNYIYHILGEVDNKSEVTPSDNLYSQLWGMKNTGQTDAAGQVGTAGADIHVSGVWGEGITGSRNIRVAVIDTGIKYDHEDLRGNVDQAQGYNFVSNTADAMDDNNHGTHCAGTIGGLGNNNRGVTGVNWNVTMIPVKFLSAQGGGSLDAAVQAIQWAISRNVNIMSNSWGGGPYSQALYDVIAQARDAGITFIAAAGNDANNNDANASYPASYDLPNVISVAATDNRDQLATFSNYGRTRVHVAAPGVKILSSVKNGSYDTFSGTSMATPHVAGIAALLLSANPSMTYSQIKSTLMRTSDPVRGLSRKVASRGRVNAYNAIHNIEPVVNGPNEADWRDFAFTVETPNPYANSQTYSYPINVPNARYIRVVFDSIGTESGYDLVKLQDASGQNIETLSGNLSNYTSDYVEGGQATITLTTDESVPGTGFRVGRLQVIY